MFVLLHRRRSRLGRWLLRLLLWLRRPPRRRPKYVAVGVQIIRNTPLAHVAPPSSPAVKKPGEILALCYKKEGKSSDFLLVARLTINGLRTVGSVGSLDVGITFHTLAFPKFAGIAFAQTILHPTFKILEGKR